MKTSKRRREEVTTMSNSFSQTFRCVRFVNFFKSPPSNILLLSCGEDPYHTVPLRAVCAECPGEYTVVWTELPLKTFLFDLTNHQELTCVWIAWQAGWSLVSIAPPTSTGWLTMGVSSCLAGVFDYYLVQVFLDIF